MTRENKTIQLRHTQAIKKGEIINKDGFILVALNDAVENELIAYGVEGGFNFVGADNHGLDIADRAYYIEAEKKVTKVKGSNIYLGRVVLVEGNEVEIKINVGA